MSNQVATLRSGLKKVSPAAYWREILALLMLLLAIVFFRSERKELHAIIPHLKQSSPLWLLAGLAVTLLYIFLQAGIYKKSFDAIGLFLNWLMAIALFLKRNFISVFLPAGGVSSLAYSPSQIRQAGFNKTHVQQASALFGFAGLLTVFIAGLPVIMFTFFSANRFNNAWAGMLALLLIISLLYISVISLKNRGRLFNWLENKFPSIIPTLNDLFSANVNSRKFLGAVWFSLGVELCGMAHVYIAMMALGVHASIYAAVMAYIIAVLMMIVSPFLRGLGAVELSMVYVLEQFGYNSTQALSITVLYRVFEFWIPMVAGFIAFAWKGRQLFFRTAPALLTFALGLVNIISSITPPIHNRSHFLREYLPLSIIHASNLLVLFVGLALLVTSAFLFRGLRNAWLMALIFSVFSLAGHLTKALDYEEAIIAAITAIVLIITTSQYRIKSSYKWMQAGVMMAFISLTAVYIFGFISFDLLSARHFGVDFNWQQSLHHTLTSILLIEDTSLHPQTTFAHELIWMIRIPGFIAWGFLLMALTWPHADKQINTSNYRERAAFLLSEFGNSVTDYFKLYRDKLYFFSAIHEAFIAYRVAGGFAIVLEEPVCAAENKVDVLEEFDNHCRRMGLKPAFYRVDEDSIPWFNQLKKRRMMIGQEAILDINKFSLEGREKKSLRNGLNSLQKKNYTVTVNHPPYTDNFLHELRNVSDEWLRSLGKEEYIFSQGMFDEKELGQQDIITLQDAEEKIKAFINIIPDFAEDECTYDLIRKTDDAPGAAMDALIIKLIAYAKEQNKLYINLGLVPLTGILQPHNTAEQIVKLAAAKIKRFQHYQGLREFKEKYATIWENKYLVYDNDFDLLQLPMALNTVMKTK